MDRTPQLLVEKTLLFGGITVVIDPNQLREPEFTTVEQIEFHTPRPGHHIGVLRFRGTPQYNPEPGHLEYDIALAVCSAQCHQVVAHRIDPPQRIEPQ